MSLVVDTKYISLASSQLDKFKRKNSYLYNFRCPYCGDSKKNLNKARGFFYRKKDGMYYKCHNCGKGTTTNNFLKDLNPSLHRQYTLEKFSGGSRNRNYDKPELKFEQPKFKPKLSEFAIPIGELNHDHVARLYLSNRKIPNDKIFYWTDCFGKFVHDVVPNKYPSLQPDEGRLIIPFYSESKELMMLQGRSLSMSAVHDMRYISIKVIDESPKIFGLDRINRKEIIHVVEGPFDSLFIPNCLAMAGGDFDGLVSSVNNKECIMIYDNEPRNTDTIRRMTKMIDLGYDMYFWPDNIKEKDINEYVLSGKNNFLEQINNNTYRGLGAKMKLSSWRKC